MPDHGSRRHGGRDLIVIVGAGPAGIAAALKVRELGLAATIIDDNPAPGGQIWRGDTKPRHQLDAAAVETLTATRVVSIDPETHSLVVENAGSALTLTFTKLILAPGSRELFLPFPGWTLPGVFGAGGLQALVKSGLDVRGKRIIVGGTGPLLLAVAALLRRKGANLLFIAEQAPPSALVRFATHLLANPGKLGQGASLAWSLAGTPYLTNCWVQAAEGSGKLQRVHIRQGTKRWTEDCDYAAIGYGLIPNTELHTMAGTHADIISAGTGDVEYATLSGSHAACTAAGRDDLAPDLTRATAFAAAMRDAFTLRPELRTLAAPETIVCRCEDVSYGRLQPYSSFRAAKLQTRCGMGPCQGRICGAAANFLFNWADTSVRPPAFPARIDTLAAPATKE